jgi:hypothetical protein
MLLKEIIKAKLIVLPDVRKKCNVFYRLCVILKTGNLSTKT